MGIVHVGTAVHSLEMELGWKILTDGVGMWVQLGDIQPPVSHTRIVANAIKLGIHYPCLRPVNVAREHGYCVPSLSYDSFLVRPRVGGSVYRLNT